MLFTSDLQDTEFKGMYKAELEGNKVIILAYITTYGYYDHWEQIGYYNLDNKEGRILLEGYKDFKWYKNLKSIWNAIYKIDNNASITSYETIVNKIRVAS